MPLRYLFQATYKDGTVYKQNEEDKSVTEPDTRSCFFDVKQDEVKTFFVFNDNHTYSVNLEDGHFEIDGVPVFMHTDPRWKDFRLIYYRQHTHNLTTEGQELGHSVEYCLGWQTNDENGENVKRIMTLVI